MPVELNLDELKVSEPDADELRKIFTELEFKALADKFLNKTENSKKNVQTQLDLFAENPTDGQVFQKRESESVKRTATHIQTH